MIDRRKFVQGSFATTLLAGISKGAPPGVLAGLEFVNGDFERDDNSLGMQWGGKRVFRYVYRDDKITRPYFETLKTLDGTQVSRNHPPRAGVDLADHDLMHPGLWLAFGDLNGQDNWRLKAPVRQDEPIAMELHATGNPVDGSETVQAVMFFATRRYLSADGKDIARENYHYVVRPWRGGWRMMWDSKFEPAGDEIIFGDQEEMGLGVRLATPLIVQKGGAITNSLGGKNEKGCWGKRAEWCDYSGQIGGKRYGILLMPHPKNFKPSTFHVRDYGLMLANPFAEKAFGHAASPAKTVVKKGDSLRLRFGILVYSVLKETPLDAIGEFASYVNEANRIVKEP